LTDSQETSFTVTGGRGSIRYTLADIAAAGAKLARIGHELSFFIDRLRVEMLALDAAGRAASRYPYASADALRGALWSSMGAQAGMAEVARDAVTAAENYNAAEAHNARLTAQLARTNALWDGLDAWTWGPAMPLKLALDGWGAVQDAGARGLRDAVEDALNQGPAYVAGAMGPGAALAYFLAHPTAPNPADSGVVPALAVRKILDTSGLATPGSLRITRVLPGGTPDVVEPTIAGLLAGSKDAYGYPPGSLSVLSIDRSDGTRAWIVHLPGTEDWSRVDSENPWDFEGDLEGMTAPQAAMFAQQQVLIQEFMKGALHDAGALPTEDVLITGHSGGGIHAAAAAANPAFLAEVNVRAIVIAGAPAKNLHVAPDIAVLDLQNDNDVVAAADFGPPPDAPNWVSVSSHRGGVAGGAAPLAQLREAHGLENYIEDAQNLESSADPAIAGARAAVAAFFGSAAVAGTVGTVAVRKSVYQARDIAEPPAKGRPREGNPSGVRGY